MNYNGKPNYGSLKQNGLKRWTNEESDIKDGLICIEKLNRALCQGTMDIHYLANTTFVV